MILNIAKVLLGLLGCARAQTFVVLALPPLPAVRAPLPLLELREREETFFVLPIITLLAFFPHLDDGSGEFLQKTIHLHQRRPPMVYQVDQQTLDVGAVVVLVRHQHDGTVPEPLRGIVLLPRVQTHDLQQILDLGVACDLFEVCVPDIQHLALERKDTILVSTDDAQASDRQRLGRITLRQDQRAVLRVLAARIVGVLQLRNAENSCDVLRHLQLAAQVHLLLRARPVENEVDDAALHHLLDRFLGQLASGAKLALLQRERLLRLGVKCGVHDERVDEDPQMTSHMLGFDLNPTAVLTLHNLEDHLHELIGDVLHVRPSLNGVDGVHEAHLREGAIADAEGDLPVVVATLIDARRRPRFFTGFRLLAKVQLNVVFKRGNWQNFAVEFDLHPLVRGTCNIVDTFHHETNDVVVQ
mmetsp:Transcript_9905/g.27630  ORF Transcript_9905/g.27630 Transcript_9905/m.27630 type:complete len:414 (+) Transcript_9905:2738-3979(+)